MDMVSPDFIHKLRNELKKNPKSQLFAPLSEGLRKSGQLHEALQIGLKGLNFHPKFAAGHLAVAHIYFDQSQFAEALDHLTEAVDISPENILAHKLMADCYLKLKNPKKALRSYKMVLFLNPNHEKAKQAVKKLESLTADEFEEEVFEKLKLKTPEPGKEPQKLSEIMVERTISLIDAFLARNDIDKAKESLIEAEKRLGHNEELIRRKRLIQQVTESTPAPIRPLPTKAEQACELIDEKINILQKILKNIENQPLDK